MAHEGGIPVEVLSAAAFADFGWVLGTPPGNDSAVTGFSHPGSDFWHAHDFDPGAGGETEVLWVRYRNDCLRLRSLEVHWLTEQAIIPLGDNGIVHVVCPARDDGSRLPDVARLRCFRVDPGRGICMRPGCWHASFVLGGEATCLMLTRRSTTRDLAAHLRGESVAAESSIQSVVGPGEAGVLLRA